MGYIGNEPTTGHFPVDNFTSSGGSTYTLAKAPASAGAIEVSVQGVLQPTTAYTVSGTTLTMAGVTTGVKIFVRHLGETLSLPTPADGSVTTAKLGVNAVDGTKIAMGSDARGDILYHGATDYARLAKGTSGQLLTMGANDPAWATAAAAGLTLGTKQATTSGTAFTFGSIPSGVSLIFVNFYGVSLSGSDDLLVYLGDAGGLETSGYISTGNSLDSTNIGHAASTAGFIIDKTAAAGLAVSGNWMFTRHGTSYEWVGSYTGGSSDATVTHHAGGHKTLSAELTQVSVDTTGSDTFDAGSLNISYM